MNSKTITYCVAAVVIVAVVACLAIALAQGSDDTGDDGPTVPSTPEPEEPTAPVVQSPRWHTVILDPFGDGSAYDYMYVDVGDRLSEPNDPTDYYRIFTGWVIKDTSNAWDFSKVVTSDMILVGQWEDHFSVDKGISNATLTLNDAWTSGSTLIDWGDGTTDSLSPGESVIYHEYAVDSATVEVTTVLRGQTYSSNCYLTNIDGGGFANMLRTFRVTFDSYGGSSVETQIVTWGQTAHSPRTPTDSGYVFLGWYLGNNLYDFSQPVYSDLRLVARWTEDPYYSASVIPEATATVTGVSSGWILDASDSVDATHFEWYVYNKLEGVGPTLTISYEMLEENNGYVSVTLYAYSETMNYRTWTYWFSY